MPQFEDLSPQSGARAPRRPMLPALALALILIPGLFAWSCDAAGNSDAVQPEHAAPDGKLSLHDARIRAVPPGVQISAAYFRVTNRTDQDDRLLYVRMAGAGRVEIHETTIDDEGVMRMRPLADGLPVPAGATVSLKPGGAHLMLMQLSVEPRVGETIPLECEFEGAGKILVNARVFNGD